MDKAAGAEYLSSELSFRESKADLTQGVILGVLGLGWGREETTGKPMWAGSRKGKEELQAGTEPSGPLP